MILQELANLYDRLAADPEIKIPGMGWSVENVSYRIRIDDNGRTTGVIPYVVGEGKEQRRFVKRIVPEHASRTSGIQPFFLCDNGCYLFCRARRGARKSLAPLPHCIKRCLRSLIIPQHERCSLSLIGGLRRMSCRAMTPV